MKKQILTVIFLEIALNTVICDNNSKSLDAQIGNRHAFNLFENFDGSKNSYIQETALIHKLKDIKVQMKTLQDSIKTKKDLKRFAENLKDLKDKVNQIKSNLNNSTNEFPNPDKSDLYGAQKGMEVLFFTYRYNVTSAVIDGNLEFYDYLFQKKIYKCHEKLTLTDLRDFAAVGFSRKFYSSSIDLIRGIYETMKKVENVDEKFKKRIENMKNELVKLNNGYLDKMQTFVGKIINHIK